MSAEWNPKKYKDDYRDALMDVIEEKVEAGGEEIEEKPRPKKPSPKVIDLVAVLQKSLAQSQGHGKKKTETKRRGGARKAA
jgi:DNA end-binding protein Ku